MLAVFFRPDFSVTRRPKTAVRKFILLRVCLGASRICTFYFLPISVMGTGASLTAGALTAATSGAGEVIEAFANTASALMPYFLIIAAVGASLWAVKFVVKRFTKVHRG